MRRSTRLFFLLTLSGCVVDTTPEDTNAPKQTPSDTPECTEDIECGGFDICIDEICAVGDRNNSQEEATRVFQGQVAEDVIAPSGDKDWYVYTSPGDEWIRIQTKTNVEDCSETQTETIDTEVGIDTVVTIRNSVNGATHAVMDNFPTGRITTYDTVLNAYLPEAGDWYIIVEDVSTYYNDLPDRGDVDFHYCLEVTDAISSTSETDSLETPSLTINMTSPNSIWTGGVVLGEEADSDFFRLTVNDPGPIEIYGHEEIPGSDAIPLVKVYNPAQELVSVKEGIGGEAGRLVYFHATPGDYFIEASDALSAGGGSYWYPLYFRTRTEGYWGMLEAEPNESLDFANVLTPFDTTTNNGTPYRIANFNGTLEGEDDADWFSVFVDESWISVVCSADVYGSEVDLAAEIYDGGGNLLATQLTGSDNAPDLYNLTLDGSTDVKIKLYAEDGFTGPSAYYYCVTWLTNFEASTP